MASTEAIKAEEARFVRMDKHMRELLKTTTIATAQVVQAVSINMIIGNGVDVIATGVAGALRVDFDCIITGSFLQEVDAVTGSIVLAIHTSPGGASPSWTLINASAPPTISSARFSEDEVLTGWTTTIAAGTYIRWSVTSVSSFTRILSVLRVTRV